MSTPPPPKEVIESSPNYTYSLSDREELQNEFGDNNSEGFGSENFTYFSDENLAVGEDKSSYKDYVLSITSAIGGFEPIIEAEDKNYQPKYLPDPSRKLDLFNKVKPIKLEYQKGHESLGCLQDIRKLLKREEKGSKVNFNLTTRNLLYRFDLIEKDLLPILSLQPDIKLDKLGRTVFELLTYLITPLLDKPFLNNLASVLFEEMDLQRKDDSVDGKDMEENKYEKETFDLELNSDELEDFGYQETIVESDNESDTDLNLEDSKVDYLTKLKLHNRHLHHYKKLILQFPWLIELVVFEVAEILQLEQLRNADDQFLFLSLVFLDSLVKIGKDDKFLQSKLIVVLNDALGLELLNTMAGLIELKQFQHFTELVTSILFNLFHPFQLEYLFNNKDLHFANNLDEENESTILLRQLELEKLTNLQLDTTAHYSRHSRFGGTNNLLSNTSITTTVNGIRRKGGNIQMFGGATHLPSTSTPNNITSIRLKQGGSVKMMPNPSTTVLHQLPTLPINNIEHLLASFTLTKADGHHKRKKLKVDYDFKIVPDTNKVLGPVEAFLNKFISTGLLKLTLTHFKREKVRVIDFNETGKLLYILYLAFYYLNQNLLNGRNSETLKATLPLLSNPKLISYLMDTMLDLKLNNQIKALQQCLLTLQQYLYLIVNLRTTTTIKNTIFDEQIKQLAQKQLHSFVYEYVLLKPLNDLFSKHYHPYLNDALVQVMFTFNSVVKVFVKSQADSLIVAKKKAKKSKRKEAVEDGADLDDFMSTIEQSVPDDEDAYDDFVLDYDKYMRSYATDSIIQAHIIHLESTLSKLKTNPAEFMYSTTARQSLNLRIQHTLSILHHLIVQQGGFKLVLKLSYLKVLRDACLQAEKLQELIDKDDKLEQVDSKEWKWVKELAKFARFVTEEVVFQINQNSDLLVGLEPKSWKKVNSRVKVPNSMLQEDYDLQPLERDVYLEEQQPTTTTTHLTNTDLKDEEGGTVRSKELDEDSDDDIQYKRIKTSQQPIIDDFDADEFANLYG